jgi:hypothetical protein
MTDEKFEKRLAALHADLGELKRDLRQNSQDVRESTQVVKKMADSIAKIDGRVIRVEESRKYVFWTLAVSLPIIFAMLAGIGAELIHMNGALSGLAAQVGGMTQSTINSLLSSPNPTKEEVAQNAATAATVIADARRNKIRSDLSELNKSGEQLLSLTDKYSDVPSVWNASAQLISYKSEQTVNLRPSIPECKYDPSGFKITGVSDAPNGRAQLTHGPIVHRNCRLVLDDPQTLDKLSADLSFASVIFENCVVVYNGGPVVVHPVKVATDTPARIVGGLSFNNCLFVFTFNSVPAPYGQAFAKQLLPSTEMRVSITPTIG